jgi:hypothetical protein
VASRELGERDLSESGNGESVTLGDGPPMAVESVPMEPLYIYDGPHLTASVALQRAGRTRELNGKLNDVRLFSVWEGMETRPILRLEVVTGMVGGQPSLATTELTFESWDAFATFVRPQLGYARYRIAEEEREQEEAGAEDWGACAICSRRFAYEELAESVQFDPSSLQPMLGSADDGGLHRNEGRFVHRACLPLATRDPYLAFLADQSDHDDEDH